MSDPACIPTTTGSDPSPLGRGALAFLQGWTVAVDVELERFLVELRSKLALMDEHLRPVPMCFKMPDAAARLGVSLSKLKQMVRAGELRTSTVGGSKMIAHSELLRVAAPDADKPAVEREQAAHRWEPIQKRRR